MFDTIRESQAGHFQGGVHVFGLKEKGVSWVCDANNQALIPAPVKARVDSLEREIVTGRITAPTQ